MLRNFGFRSIIRSACLFRRSFLLHYHSRRIFTKRLPKRLVRAFKRVTDRTPCPSQYRLKQTWPPCESFSLKCVPSNGRSAQRIFSALGPPLVDYPSAILSECFAAHIFPSSLERCGRRGLFFVRRQTVNRFVIAYIPLIRFQCRFCLDRRGRYNICLFSYYF